LNLIGVREGWRCLDVGAGGGSATRLLAERVGDTGSVLAVDLDTRLLAPLASARVEVRRHDLLADPLPDGAFDLVHARNLLMHLPARVDALRRLLAAVRPLKKAPRNRRRRLRSFERRRKLARWHTWRGWSR
jgi:SAM-dependent methyltransferase